MKNISMFWIPKKWDISKITLKTQYTHPNSIFKHFFKWPIVWKNIMLKVLNHQFMLAKLKVQYGIFDKVIQTFQNKVVCAFSTLLITFKLTFETDFLKSFWFKKPFIWTLKEKFRYMNELNFLNYRNFNGKHLKIKYKLIQQLLVLIFKPLIFVRKGFRNNIFCRKLTNLYLFLKCSFFKKLPLNSFPIWNIYLKKYKKLTWIFSNNQVTNSSFQLLAFNQMVQDLSKKILKNLLWSTFKVKLIFGRVLKTKKPDKSLNSKIYYSLYLKYCIRLSLTYCIIFCKNASFARFLIDSRFRKFILKNVKIKKINDFENCTYGKFFKKQLEFSLRNKLHKFESVLSVNKFILNLYTLLKQDGYKFYWKELDLYLYRTCLKWVNKKDLNRVKNFLFENFKFSKKGICLITFKNLYR